MWSAGTAVTIVSTLLVQLGVQLGPTSTAVLATGVEPIGNTLSSLTTMVTVEEPPAGTVPIFQVTVPAVCVPPALALTNDVRAGTASVSVTPVALARPVLLKPIV